MAGNDADPACSNGSTIRFAPPLTIEADELDWMAERFAEALSSSSAG